MQDNVTAKPDRPGARWLERAPGPVFVLWAVVAAFSAYLCMYAFRKPFGAAKFEGLKLFDTEIDLKTAFVVSQIIGYALSKFIGIKVCSEVTRSRRGWLLIGFIVWAELALLLFAILPADLKIIAMFLNGIPLGMVWGLVVWYLEGRRTSELLLAGLSCAFILGSGIVKDVGTALLSGADRLTLFAVDLPEPVGSIRLMAPNPFLAFGQIGEFWMPFVTGLLFLPPFLVAVWMLWQVPNPSRDDEAARTHREPMNAAHRWAFVRHFLPGLLVLFVAYFFLTAYRDFRDNFGIEIFSDLGEDGAGIFSRSETLVAFGVLVPLALLFLIRNNRWGLFGAFAIMTTGTALLAVAAMLFQGGHIGGLHFMILTGLGSYLAYVPYGSVLFDRMIASTRVVGTAVFAIYVADAIGYTGAISVMLFKDIVVGEMSRLDFFIKLTYFMSILGTAGLIVSAAYFLTRRPRHVAAAPPAPVVASPDPS